MRGMVKLGDLMDKLEDKNIRVQKLIDNNENTYSRAVTKSAIVFLLIEATFAKKNNKFLEIWEENKFTWTVRITDFWGTDITEYRIRRCRQEVA